MPLSTPLSLSGIHMLVCTLKALRSPVVKRCVNVLKICIAINIFDHGTLVFSYDAYEQFSVLINTFWGSL